MTTQVIRNKRSLTRESESFGTNEVTLESVQDETSSNQDVTSSKMQVVQEEFRAKRSRKSKDQNELEGIKTALNNIAEALKEGNAALRESILVQQKLPNSEAEIWKLLEVLKIENHLFIRAYLYLIDKPKMVRGLLGCPKNKQKDLLMEMVFGPAALSRC